MSRDPYTLPGDPNLPPGVTDRMIEEAQEDFDKAHAESMRWFDEEGPKYYEEPDDCPPEVIEQAMEQPPCEDGDHDLVAFNEPWLEPFLYCTRCGHEPKGSET